MNSLLEILGLAILVSFTTNLVRRKLITKEDTLKMAESQVYKKSLLEARKKGDEKLVQKLMKKQEYYQKIDAQIAKKNILTLLITLAIFYISYIFIAQTYGDLVIASLPSDLTIPFISHGSKITVTGWFIITLIASGLPISKILGVGAMPEISKEVEKKVKE
ncbi:MAG: EMC3/TMCO1 family protein [Aigarchaeota archaeon]|nr:EMC3/TMCO1 family protein [Aigarchaeota archaeon]MCX8193073.1 EMC3/TMCO1 family protein [Nitrososphaeria archaeon]MDW7986922.1 EMC3/TMCO1 family protein [Nitrososphaerota archaeon]